MARLKLKPSKCVFSSPEVDILGYKVTEEGILPDPDNVEKIVNWPRPKNVHNVQCILGIRNYYQRFVRNFSDRVKPVVPLTMKDKLFDWTPECQADFEDIKQVLMSPDIMAFPLDDAPFILDTDALDDTVGTVLSQVQNGVKKVIAYGNRTLGKSERNYCTWAGTT